MFLMSLFSWIALTHAQGPAPAVDYAVLKKAETAIREGSLEDLRESLSEGWHPKIRFSDGSTPLGQAAWQGTFEVIEFLTEHGADVDDGGPYMDPLKSSLMRAESLLLGVAGDSEESPSHDDVVPKVRTQIKISHYLLDRGAKASPSTVRQSCALYWYVASRTAHTLKYGLRTGLRSEAEALVARVFYAAATFSIEELHAAITCGSSLAVGIVLKREPTLVREKIMSRFDEATPLGVALLKMPAGGPEMRTISSMIFKRGGRLDDVLNPVSETLNPSGQAMSLLAYVAAQAYGAEAVDWMLGKGARPQADDLKVARSAQEGCLNRVSPERRLKLEFDDPCSQGRVDIRAKTIARFEGFF